jgi:hypothetical protein
MAESELNQNAVTMRRRVSGEMAVEPSAREIDSDPIVRSCRTSAESGSQC